jgi:glucosamine--fructose-6-phosphate aminotransferase (isomerizing)
LAEKLKHEPLRGTVGIAHTRWATHGAPNETNAHPIATAAVAVVHNGIIENYRELRECLERDGARFQTQTDTEVAAVLLDRYLGEGMTPLQAVDRMLGQVVGAFALAMLFTGEDDLIICARRGSPLAVGFGEGEMFAGSDALALAPMTQRIAYLEEGDRAVLTRERARFYDAEGRPVEREVRLTAITGALTGKGNHRHFMQKEIFEQPAVIGDTLHAVLNPTTRRIQLPDLPFGLPGIERVMVAACGTSHHAGLVARYWIERIAGVPVEIDVASELATATPRSRAAPWWSAFRSPARRRTRSRRSATPRSKARRRWASSTSRRAPWPARSTRCSRPAPGRRSASPRPRPSRPSSWCSRA